MEKVKNLVVVIIYNGVDITRDIAAYVLEVSHTDYLQSYSDEIAITLDDSSNLWKSDWYPAKGDSISLSMGYSDDSLVKCGDFDIDELESSGSPDIFTIRALAAHKSKELREKNNKKYEKTTLALIVESIAEKNGYKVFGEIEPITFDCVTQFNETDLHFMKRISEKYGYAFRISGSSLIFYNLANYELSDETKRIAPAMKLNTSIIVNRTDVTSFRFVDRTHGTYKMCTVSYLNPKTKKTEVYTAKSRTIKVGETLKIVERCESKQQAEVVARANLNKANRNGSTSSISLPGNKTIFSGSVITLKGFHKNDGNYLVEKSTRTMKNPDSFTMELELSRVI